MLALKQQEVTGGSILLSRQSFASFFSFFAVFFFLSCSIECFVITMIVIAIHPHLAALFFITKITFAPHKYSSKQMPLMQREAVAALLSKTFV